MEPARHQQRTGGDKAVHQNHHPRLGRGEESPDHHRDLETAVLGERFERRQRPDAALSARASIACLRASPASSTPVPRPTHSVSGTPPTRCSSSEADAVLPMPISPKPMTFVPCSAHSRTSCAPMRMACAIARRSWPARARSWRCRARSCNCARGLGRKIVVHAGVDHLHRDARLAAPAH